MRELEMEAPSAGTPGGFSGQTKSKDSHGITHQDTRSNNNSFSQYSLLDLLSDLKRTGTSKSGPEYHGPCPFCGGTDRFVVWPEKGNAGRYWCRQCRRHGDAIQLLRDRDGLTFIEAKRQLGLSTNTLSRPAVIKHRARRAALRATRETFRDWARRKMIALTDEYREELPFELEVAEAAYCQIQRRPDLYTEEEAQWWMKRLGALYDRIPVLEYQLDLLTYDKHELGCVKWWREETQRGDYAPGRAA
jgi:hypothetical protein